MPQYSLTDYTTAPAPTFELPTDKKRKNLKVGHFAKVVFDEKERMWVKITKVLKNGSYEGVLDNEPFFVSGVKWGDRIRFKWNNVINIMEP